MGIKGSLFSFYWISSGCLCWHSSEGTYGKDCGCSAFRSCSHEWLDRQFASSSLVLLSSNSKATQDHHWRTCLLKWYGESLFLFITQLHIVYRSKRVIVHETLRLFLFTSIPVLSTLFQHTVCCQVSNKTSWFVPWQESCFPETKNRKFDPIAFFLHDDALWTHERMWSLPLISQDLIALHCVVVTLFPSTRFQGESLVREDDALQVIEEHGESTAVILIPGIQYYTGQLFNIPLLTKVSHSKGIIVGSDLAHAVGNVPLFLHDWGVDFAAWCTYKYLNAGAGCIAGIFVHEKWTSDHEKPLNEDFPMLKGWWGNTPSTKFSMKDDFEAASGADMFKLSNPPAVLCAMLMASLDIFSQTSMQDISKKQFLLTGYLEYLLKSHFKLTSCLNNNEDENIFHQEKEDTTASRIPVTTLPSVEIITPSNPKERGSQLSICFSIPLACVQDELKKRGIVVRYYNAFYFVYSFCHQRLKEQRSLFLF